MEAGVTVPLAVRWTVEHLLSVRFGMRVRVAGVEDFPYSRVSRCTLEAASGAVPTTVIVRVPRGPGDDPARSSLARLRNERAALEFLSLIGSTLVPRYIAGDAAAGILITEDLGTDSSLLDLLLGDDREAARQGLLAFARGLGTLHAQTVGRAPEYNAHRAKLGPAGADAIADLAGVTTGGDHRNLHRRSASGRLARRVCLLA